MNTLYYDHLWYLCFIRKCTHDDESDYEIFLAAKKLYKGMELRMYRNLYMIYEKSPTEEKLAKALNDSILESYKRHWDSLIDMSSFDFLVVVEYDDYQR